MPGVLIEAGLSGLPVVTTDVSGARAIVEEGVTGFVLPSDDVGGLTDALGRLVDDADLRRRMGAAARDRCAERFSIEAVAREWRDLLDPLLSPR
jgi:glycosyltransferase involved in cell wall biosynthesis